MLNHRAERSRGLQPGNLAQPTRDNALVTTFIFFCQVTQWSTWPISHPVSASENNAHRRNRPAGISSTLQPTDSMIIQRLFEWLSPVIQYPTSNTIPHPIYQECLDNSVQTFSQIFWSQLPFVWVALQDRPYCWSVSSTVNRQPDVMSIPQISQTSVEHPV